MRKRHTGWLQRGDKAHYTLDYDHPWPFSLCGLVSLDLQEGKTKNHCSLCVKSLETTIDTLKKDLTIAKKSK